MPVPIDFYDATTIWQSLSNPRQFTWGLGLTTVPTAGSESAATVAESFYGACTATGSVADPQYIYLGYQFLGVQVALETTEGPLVAQVLDTVAGTATGATVPCNSAVLVTKQTALGGRRNKGRLYHPPVFPGETLIDQNGIINSGDLAAIQGQFDTLIEGLGDADLLAVLFHQSGAQTPTPITGFSVQSLLASQRRRMR